MKEKIISISFFAFLVIFMFLNIVIKDKDISVSERRKLDQFPELSVDRVLDKSFMEDFDEYTLDQFIGRDYFRSLKATYNYKLLFKLDNNNIYIKGDYIYKNEYPTNQKSITNFINKINKTVTLLSPNNKVYYSIIPDKNYYLTDKLFLQLDYGLLYSEVINNVNIANFIDLRENLTTEDYYKTDTHWRQEKLASVVEQLENSMHFKTTDNYETHTVPNFYGVYYGQAALNMKGEDITYLTNTSIDNSTVKYYEDATQTQVYTLDNINNLDKYDIFLDGASPFIEIINPNNHSGRELIIFRDSFGSSLTPLLIEAYSKITLIDTRYISSDIYLTLVNFKNQDVLFLYSTLIVNNSVTLKN